MRSMRSLPVRRKNRQSQAIGGEIEKAHNRSLPCNPGISELALHGYSILFAAVFLEAVGLPVPAALALLIAGGASARGSLHGSYALGGSLLAMLAGDALMFVMGRYAGWWLLGILCRISLNPESCILRSADSFYRRGRALLVVAKFIPGINTMAPPLAGCMNMSLTAVPWAGSGRCRALYRRILWGRLPFQRRAGSDYPRLPDVRPGRRLGCDRSGCRLCGRSDLAVDQSARTAYRSVRDPFGGGAPNAAGAYIYDVRSHGYLDARATRITGSRRLDPHSLNRCGEEFPDGQLVYVYCTCVREATSVRVARELQDEGFGSR